jgi:cobyrinic acid a,c-diamide synthase
MRILVSAAHKSSGKTTVSIGLCAALRCRGLAVQPFKKGPDFIDPMWLTKAAGRACRNLDPYLSSRDEIVAAFRTHSRGADACVVEGNKGLHDGMSLDGRDSSAAVARMVGLPVVLVIDARGITRGVAPLVLGQQAFEPDVRIAGAILNRVAGPRHESKLRAALEHCTNVPVLGAIGEDRTIAIVERHLGLMPSNESGDAARVVEAIARTVEASVDVDRLLAIEAPPLPRAHAAARGASTTSGRVRIGIARDAAFGFYYPDDLDAFAAAGATLVPFDTLANVRLPDVDALFIGGGFPEAMAARLAANRSLRAEILARIQAGMPVYAECGGLMYLARSIEWNGERHEMVGALPADAVMSAKPVGRGYVELEETPDFPWKGGGGRVRAHEFHHSRLVDVAPGLRYAYRVVRGHGVDGERDGIVFRNVLASYAHLRSVGGVDWPRRFVAFVRAQKAQRAVPFAEFAAPFC